MTSVHRFHHVDSKNSPGPHWTLSTLDFERLLPLVSTSAHPAAKHAIEELDLKLANATLVPPDQMAGNVVTMNSKVLLHCASWEQPREYRLVYPRRGPCDSGEVSVVSPLGAGLLGARVGDHFTLGSQPHARSFHLVALTYQPETAGDWEL